MDSPAAKSGRTILQKRRAVRVEVPTEAELEAIRTAEVPAKHAYLDEEVGDWQP